MNLYEQQAANRHRTWLIMLTFVAFLLVLGLAARITALRQMAFQERSSPM